MTDWEVVRRAAGVVKGAPADVLEDEAILRGDYDALLGARKADDEIAVLFWRQMLIHQLAERFARGRGHPEIGDEMRKLRQSTLRCPIIAADLAARRLTEKIARLREEVKGVKK
jgi:hypothetical protein